MPDSPSQTLVPDADGKVTLPDWVLDGGASFDRTGADLVVRDGSGQSLTLPGYYSAGEGARPELVSASGLDIPRAFLDTAGATGEAPAADAPSAAEEIALQAGVTDILEEAADGESASGGNDVQGDLEALLDNLVKSAEAKGATPEEIQAAREHFLETFNTTLGFDGNLELAVREAMQTFRFALDQPVPTLPLTEEQEAQVQLLQALSGSGDLEQELTEAGVPVGEGAEFFQESLQQALEEGGGLGDSLGEARAALADHVAQLDAIRMAPTASGVDLLLLALSQGGEAMATAMNDLRGGGAFGSGDDAFEEGLVAAILEGESLDAALESAAAFSEARATALAEVQGPAPGGGPMDLLLALAEGRDPTATLLALAGGGEEGSGAVDAELFGEQLAAAMEAGESLEAAVQTASAVVERTSELLAAVTGPLSPQAAFLAALASGGGGGEELTALLGGGASPGGGDGGTDGELFAEALMASLSEGGDLGEAVQEAAQFSLAASEAMAATQLPANANLQMLQALAGGAPPGDLTTLASLTAPPGGDPEAAQQVFEDALLNDLSQGVEVGQALAEASQMANQVTEMLAAVTTTPSAENSVLVALASGNDIESLTDLPSAFLDERAELPAQTGNAAAEEVPETEAPQPQDQPDPTPQAAPAPPAPAPAPPAPDPEPDPVVASLSVPEPEPPPAPEPAPEPTPEPALVVDEPPVVEEVPTEAEEAEVVIPNLPPMDLRLSGSTLDENTPGAVVGELVAIDSDSAGVSLSLTQDGSGLFEVVGNFLKLRDGAVVDHESVPVHSLTITATDGAGGALSRTFAIGVNDLNEQPALLLAAPTLTLAEDAGPSPLPAITLADPDDGDALTLSLTLSDPGAGAISTSGSATFDPASGIWTMTDTVAQVNAALAAATFTPSVDYDRAVTLAVAAADGGEAGTQPLAATIALALAPVADPPTLTGGSFTLATQEGGGTLALGGMVVADPDTGASLTATLTLADPLAGTLASAAGGSFQADSGVWSVTGSVAVVNQSLGALTLSLDPEYDRPLTAAVVVSDGTASASGLITIPVTAVNDAPSLQIAQTTLVFTEGTALVELPDVVAAEVDTGEILTATLTLSDPAVGSLTSAAGGSFHAASGVWSVSGSVVAVNAALAGVTLAPVASWDTGFTIAVNLQDGLESGSVAQTGGISLGVTAVNDAPTATGLGGTVAFVEDAATVGLPDIVVADADSGESVTATLTLSDPTAGVLTVSGAASFAPTFGLWMVSGSVAEVNAALAAVSFLPAPDRDTGLTIAARIADGGEEGAAPVEGSFTLGVTAVNDAPTGNNLTTTAVFTEGAAGVALADITLADVDTGEILTATLTLADTASGSLTTLAGGTYDAATGSWSFSGSVAGINAALAAVTFVPAPEWDLDTTLAIHIGDGGENGAGALTGSVTLDVTPVNDAPTATNTSQTVIFTEDAAGVALADIVVSDLDTGEIVTATLTLADAGAGTLTTTGGGTFVAGTGVWSVTGLISSVNTALAGVAFVPTGNRDTDTSVTVVIADGGENGAAALTGTLILDVTPTNDAPTATNLTNVVTYTEGEATVALTDIVVGDADSGESLTASLTLSDPHAGSLSTADGVSVYSPATGVWTVTGSPTTVNTALAAVAFQPWVDQDSEVTLAVAVADGGENGAASLSGSIILDVTPVHDAPAVTGLGGTVAYVEGAATVALPDVVVSHPDSGEVLSASVTLGDTTTGLLVAGTGGVYDAQTGVWSVTGNLPQVNAALAALTFVPGVDNDRDTSLSVIIADADAGTPDATGSIGLNVSLHAINDAPTATNLTSTLAFVEGDASVALTDIVVSEVDTGESITARLTLAEAAAGSLTTSAGGSYQAGTGVWTVTGSVAEVNLALAGVAFVPATNRDTGLTIAVAIEDGGENGVTWPGGSMTLGVTAVNDAPTATNTTTLLTFTEDAASVALTDIVVSDVDTGEIITATLTLSNAGAGSLTTSGSATFNGVTGVWQLTDTLALVNQALAAVTLLPTANADQNFSIAVSVSDGEAVPVTGSIGVTVTAVNDAPTATNTTTTVTYVEGATTVALSDIVVTEVDTAEVVSATLTLANPLAGSLTVAGGGSYDAPTGVWTISGSVTTVNTALGAVTFVPGADWDQDTTLAVVLVDGGENGVPALSGNVTLDVTPVNDAPTATNTSQSIAFGEDAASVALGDIVVTDADTGEVITASLTLADATAGALTTTGGGSYVAGTGVWSVTGSVSAVNAALAGVAFVPAGDRDVDTTLAITIADGGENGATALSGSILLDVTPSNDAPTATGLGGSQNWTEDAASVALTDIVVTDPDTGGLVTASLTLNNLAAGSLTTSGSAVFSAASGVWSVTDSVANVNAALAAVAFVPGGNFDQNVTLGVSLTDGVAAAVTGNLTLNVTPVNDNPSATNTTATTSYQEGTPEVALTDIVVTDPDTGEILTATVTLANTATGALSTSGGGSYDAPSGVWTVTGSLTQVNAALAALSFLPDVNNDLDTTLGVVIADDTPGSTAVTGTITLNASLAAVNDAPSATNLQSVATFTEGAASVALTDIVVADPDSGEVITAKLTLSAPAAGSLSVTGGESFDVNSGLWSVTGTVAAVNSALAGVAFLPAADRDTGLTIAVSIEDGGEDGAVWPTGTITLGVTAVNDAATATNTTYATTLVEGDASLALTDIVVTDPDTGEIVTATLTLSSPGVGALTTSGTATFSATTGVWTVTDSVTLVNQALAAVAFTPLVNLDQNFTVAVSIGDGEAAPVTGTVSVAVTAVNDAPSATNLTTTATFVEGAAVVALTDIVVSEVDTSEVVTASLTLSNPLTGLLTIAGGGSYDTGTGVWSVSGSVTTVNTALAAVTFVPTADLDQDATLTVAIADGGENGAQPLSGSVTLDVTPVNDAPTATNTAQSLTFAEDVASLALGDIVVTDGDTGEVITASLTLTDATAGTLTTTGGGAYVAGTGVWSVTGSVAVVNSALAAVAFVPATNRDTGTSLMVSIADGGENGAATLTGNILLGAVAANDAPTAANLGGSLAWNEDAASVALTDIVVADPDSGATLTATLTLSARGAGTLSTSGSATFSSDSGVWRITDSVANVNSALGAVAFLPTGNHDQDVTLDFAVTDGLAAAVTGSLLLDVTPTNDAPTATPASATVTFAEGAASVALPDIVAADPDSGESLTATLTLSAVGAGTLSTAGGGSFVPATGVWSVTGNVAAVNSAIAAVTFTPTTNLDQDLTLAVTIADGGENGAQAANAGITLDVIPVNDAPTATNLIATLTFTEGAASVALTDIVVADADTGEVVSAKLTLSDPAAGTLTTAAGGSFNATSGLWSVSGSVAAVNAALAGVAFVPGGNRDTGLSIAVAIEDGGEDGVVWPSGSVTIGVTAVNDSPSATNTTYATTMTEGVASLALADIVVTDPDTGELITATLTLSDPAAGTLSVSSGATFNALSGVWAVTDTVALVNQALAAVAFVPAVDYDKNFTMAVSISDGEAAPVTGTVSVGLTAVNDAPTVTNTSTTATFTEGAAGVSLADIVITDPDTGEIVSATLTLSAPLAGQLSVSGGGSYNAVTGVWSISGSVATVNSALAAVSFLPVADLDQDTTLAVVIADGGESGAQPVTGSILLDVQPVNDAPTATNTLQSLTFNEDVASVALGDIVVSDPDTGEVMTARLTLAAPGAGSLTTSGGATYASGTGVWSVSGGVATVNAALAAVAFVPAGNRDTDSTIAVEIADGGEDGATTQNGTITLDFTPVNDAPTATGVGGSVTWVEGAASVALNDIVLTDPDTGAILTATLTLSTPGAGSLTTSGTATFTAATGVWRISDSVANVNAALAAVAFVPGTDTDQDLTLSVNLTDGVASAISGSVTLDVTPVNDAPTATPLAATVTFTEGASGVALTDIVAVDPDSGESLTGTLTLSVPTAGSLSTGGGGAYSAATGVWTMTGSVASLNSALAAVTFTPITNQDVDLTLAWRIADGGENGAAAATGSVILDVVPVNDSPTLTGATFTASYTEGVASVSLAGMSVADVDTGESLTATLTLANPAAGSLTTTGGGSYNGGTGVWTVSGSPTAVNTALGALAFVPLVNWDQDTTVSLLLADGGEDGAVSRSGTITLDVTPVNDAPTVASPQWSVTF
ncbi:MAG: hypothetical protein HQL57_00345, partial [Magnetococcales bacterium]|nr:hypothetical protein [Magnetococcales bacterium]